jgi:AraC family transcriptional regulator, L-rhamnose operon regulatory protein RhaS
MRYLLDLRLNRSAELLKNSDMRITDIALQCGFNDANYFTRQFRNFKGFSPRTYREQMHGK